MIDLISRSKYVSLALMMPGESNRGITSARMEATAISMEEDIKTRYLTWLIRKVKVCFKNTSTSQFSPPKRKIYRVHFLG